MNNTGKLDYQKKIGRIRGGDTTAMAAAQERQRRLPLSQRVVWGNWNASLSGLRG